MIESPLIYFTDAVLRAPTIGCMLMCLAAALVGVIVFLRKESLLGESLSHAAYPGVIAGVLLVGVIAGDEAETSAVMVGIMVGAFCTALLGLKLIALLQSKLKLRADSALCFVLSCFFGFGLTLASQMQFTHTRLYQQSQAYLFGQAATMTDWHILMYGILVVATVSVIVLFYKELQAMVFDAQFAATIGIKVKAIDALIFTLIVLAVVIGLRSVGVVLMSAMLIAPAAAARQYTHKLSVMLLVAGIIGAVSGFLGNYLSVEISRAITEGSSHGRFALPTGPMIVMVAATLCVFSLLFAPHRGLLVRMVRIANFRYRCLNENILKTMWRFEKDALVPDYKIAEAQGISIFYVRVVLRHLQAQGWVQHVRGHLYHLTHDGWHRAAKIVRLHRLWEVYLADYLGVGAERVHRNAEEMEHIITPELEEELTSLLRDPQRDPHHQPIPPRGEV